jgi:hypothetical protein
MGIYIGTMASVPSSVQPLAAGYFIGREMLRDRCRGACAVAKGAAPTSIMIQNNSIRRCECVVPFLAMVVSLWGLCTSAGPETNTHSKWIN